MEKTTLKPNDVAVILRPTIVDDVWTGSFDVMVSGIGPITITDKDMERMVGMGVLLASVVPLMEHDSAVAKTIIDHCNNHYGDVGEFEYDTDISTDAAAVLTTGTRCAGGLQ